MIITFWNGVFVADSLDEKGALGRAGFKLHEPASCNLARSSDPSMKCKACIANIGRRFWSDRVESATRLKEYCNPKALRTMREHLARLEKSRAIDADIVIPAPPGLNYLPYQRGGVAYAVGRKDTLLGDDMGLGKAQPIDRKVLTPTGWKEIGALKLHDEIINSAGSVSFVTGIYPQGQKPVFRVVFSDRTSTECCDEHLWLVNTPLRKSRGYEPKILSLKEIKKRLTDSSGNRLHFIPLVAPILRLGIHSKKKIDPYVLGYLLGNGGLSQRTVRVTIPDQETVDRLNELLPLGITLSDQLTTEYDWVVSSGPGSSPNSFLDEMRSLKLMGHRSETKFVPHQYLWAALKDRIALLQGLLDSDGYVQPDSCTIEYTTSSPQLAEDVAFLVRSLGGTCRTQLKKTKTLPSHRMGISLPNEIGCPFRLRRKAQAWKCRSKYHPTRAVTKVAPVGTKECVCISTSAADRLYVTDDFILTHNTIQALGFVNYTHPKRVLVVCLKSLIFNWRDEAMRWLVDDFEVWPAKTKNEAAPVKDGLFVIVNYEKIVGNNPLANSLRREWDVLIVDEAQAIKNEDSNRSKAVFDDEGLMRRSKRCLFLTGTPIENYPKEIWPIAAAIAPAKFGDWWEFMTRYCGLHKEERKIIKRDDEGVVLSERVTEEWVTTGGTHLDELQQRLRATFMVRRLKKDVLPELPPKRRQLIMLEDSKVDWSKHPQFKKWKEAYEKEYEERLARLEVAQSEQDYLTAAHELESFTGIAFEEMSDFRRETALAKLPLCLKYTEHMLASGVGSLVIWGHHREVIESTWEHFKDIAVCVHGGTPDRGPRSRENSVKAFQAGQKKIFVGQIRAAGAGLNLTVSNTTIFYESDWVPGVLSQCEDRLCRIGQKKMVHALHLILGGTLDANMVKKVVTKQEVIDRALDKMPQLKLKKVRV